VVAEPYLLGVSTRNVDDLMQTHRAALEEPGLGAGEGARRRGEELPRETAGGPYKYVWLDALFVKCREDGRIVNVACLVAVGLNGDGRREILGLDVVAEEDGAGWLAFLRSLRARGLKGVELVISDAHPGLKDAIASVLSGAAWQPCRTHFIRNLLTRVPKAAHGLVATFVRTIFAQPDAESVKAQHARTVEQLQPRLAAAAKMLGEAKEILAFTAFPKEHWRQIWSNNPQERLNREISRRTDVVGIFPNRESIVRRVGAVLCELNDDWAIVRRYMTIEKREGVAEQRVLAKKTAA
jgi:putative transposase